MMLEEYPEPARGKMTKKDKIIVIGMMITSAIFSMSILYGLYIIGKQIILG
jgi:cell division protein FtsL